MRYEIFQTRNNVPPMTELDEWHPENQRFYVSTYSGVVYGSGVPDMLDELFVTFNHEAPADFHSYAISVGDVIVFERGSAWFLDWCDGWTQLGDSWNYATVH